MTALAAIVLVGAILMLLGSVGTALAAADDDIPGVALPEQERGT